MTEPRGAAPDYTNAFLAMAWLCTFVGLTALWAVAGYALALVASVGASTLLRRIAGDR